MGKRRCRVLGSLLPESPPGVSTWASASSACRSPILSEPAHPPASFTSLAECTRSAPAPGPVPRATPLGSLPSSRHHRRRPRFARDPGPRFVPSSAFLTPTTVCSATSFAGLFRPAATSRVLLPFRGFFLHRSRTDSSSASALLPFLPRRLQPGCPSLAPAPRPRLQGLALQRSLLARRR
jgi:hypothetical protein